MTERVAGPNGSSETDGCGAHRPADPKARYRPADSSYTGFRVVRGPEK